MPAMDDVTLLREYAANNSETAFETLVARHIRLVYSAALRQTRDPHLAEEVTQAVFIILAQKAGRMGDRTILSGWLVKTTRFVALAQTRSATRRRHYEQETLMKSDDPSDTSDAVWQQISPLLDEALVQLGSQDRQAVLLRFFEGKSLAEVGGSLGVGEDAARMRVSRALDKLRRFFLKRGVTATAAIIAGAISTNSIQAAPVTLAKTVTAGAIVKGAVASGSTLALVKGGLKIMAWTKVKTTIVVGACVLLTAGTTTIALHQGETTLTGIPNDWTVLRGESSQWSSTSGVISGHSTVGDCLVASAKKYSDVTVSATVTTTNRDACIVLRMQDGDNGYLVLFVPEGTLWTSENGSHVSLVRRKAGEEETLATYNGRGLSAAGQTARIKAIAKGNSLEVRLNDVTILKTNDTAFASGFIGLRLYGDPIKPCDATFADVKIR